MISNCKVCESDNIQPHFKIREWELNRCASCGFIFVKQKPSDEELKEIYSYTYFNHSKYKDENALRLENERRLKLLKKFLPVNKSIIDVGCAGGEFIKIAKDEYDVYGMDYSKEAIQKAKNNLPELKNKLFVGDSEQFVLNQQMDAAVFWDVIEHVWDPLQVLNNISNLIKNNGIVILSTPNIGAIFAKFSGKFWPFMTPPEHLSFLTKKSFQTIADKLGFEVLEWSSKGKRANVVFLVYKIGRIFPKLIGPKIIEFLGKTFLRKISIYVPTGDIQYVVLKKKK